MRTLLPRSEQVPSQNAAQGCSAMAEEALGVVELEGFQAQGTPGRGEEGEAVTHRGQEHPMAPTGKAQFQLWGQIPLGQASRLVHGTAMPAEPMAAPSAPQAAPT